MSTRNRSSASGRALGLAMCCAVLAACGGGGGSSGGGEGGDGNGGGPGGTGTPGFAVIAWNDLGMHCVDGRDYSVFSILPPYNNLHAQVVERGADGTRRVESGITLTYEATADASGSVNTSSVGKTNFWSWVQQLFGATPAPDVGLTGNPTPSRQPAAMTFNATQQWWEADGIPVTPYDDAGAKNFYPMVKVTARDAAGKLLASTKVVLPVSDEMSCKSCHASGSGQAAARPRAGWVNDPDTERDWKKNILRLHDEVIPTSVADAGQQATYPAGTLLGSAESGQPVLCAGCHASNALGTPQRAGVKSLTAAMHMRHASVKRPDANVTLEADPTRSACYVCHPGSTTKCLRGVMGNATGADGQPAIDCQSCHGPMSHVGRSGRAGWLDEPNCQGCHDRASAGGAFTRYTSVFSAGTTPRATIDRRFATTPDLPGPGLSLYRFSRGHGGLQCEACHGSTHAEFPSSHDNDNVQSLALQGYAGTLHECGTCHATVPLTTTGGPHGMHAIGQAWVSAHGDRAEDGRTADCAACHGTDYRGSPLSKTPVARSFQADDRKVAFKAGQAVGCYDCHNGPRGE